MREPRVTLDLDDRGARGTRGASDQSQRDRVEDLSGVPDQYERLLANLARADRDLQGPEAGGRSSHLEEASTIVFDLLYSLDFRNGGELVPRLAALYGYFANELLAVGRTRDRAQLTRLRDMIATLRQSWYGSSTGAASVH
jgi:flagellar secretion chaperone FliS